MIKGDAGWREVDWAEALEHVASELKRIASTDGPSRIGALASPHSTLEELYLLRQADARPRLATTSTRGCGRPISAADAIPAPWLGMSVARVHRARSRAGDRLVPAQGPAAARAAAAAGDEARRAAVDRPRDRRRPADAGREQDHRAAVGLAGGARGDRRGRRRRRSPDAVERGCRAASRAASRRGRRRRSCSAPPSRVIRSTRALLASARALADATGATLGFLTEAANTVGAHLVEALPDRRRPERGRRCSTIRGARTCCSASSPTLDVRESAGRARGARARRARRRADVVSQRRRPARDRHAADRAVHRDVRHVRQHGGSRAELQRLRQAARRDASGVEGAARARQPARSRRASTTSRPKACAPRSPAARPTCRRVACRTRSRTSRAAARTLPPVDGALERIADVPIYFTDPLVRRSAPLQETRDARAAARARSNGRTLAALGLASGDTARIAMGDGDVRARRARSTSASPTAASRSRRRIRRPPRCRRCSAP